MNDGQLIKSKNDRRIRFKLMLTTITAIAALFFGLAGTILGLLNYRRDRPKLRISLNWDTCLVRDTYGAQAKLGRIYITNSGRRPIYMVSAGLMVFTLSDMCIRRVSVGGIKGRRLAEGDPPIRLIVPDTVETAKTLWQKHAGHWKYLRAWAVDSNGKTYLSRRPNRRPFWGLGDGKFSRELAETTPSWQIECHLEEHELEQVLNAGAWRIYPLEEVLDTQQLREEHSSWPAHLRGFPILTCLTREPDSEK